MPDRDCDKPGIVERKAGLVDRGLQRGVAAKALQVSLEDRVCLVEGAALFGLKAIDVLFGGPDEGLIVFVDHLPQLGIVRNVEHVGVFRGQTSS